MLTIITFFIETYDIVVSGTAEGGPSFGSWLVTLVLAVVLFSLYLLSVNYAIDLRIDHSNCSDATAEFLFEQTEDISEDCLAYEF